MNFQITTNNFNLFLTTHGYDNVGETMHLLSKSYDIFITATSYDDYVLRMVEYTSEYYNSTLDRIEQCFNINGDEVLLPPMIYIDFLYGFYYLQQHNDINLTDYDSFKLMWNVLQFCDYGSSTIDFKKIIAICDTYYDISELQYDFLVWYLLQQYPYNSQKFTLSHFHDSLCNLDIVAGRKLPFGLNNILLNFGCFRNVQGVYIQIP
jgi:hypothetical protein